MANELERLCKMLDEGDAELQCAAARVLRELKPKEPGVRKALVAALKASNDTVRVYAVEALAAIDVEAALPHFVPLLAGPENLRSRATQAFLAAGEAAVKVLKDHLDAKDAQVRKGVLDILGRLPGVDTTDTLFAGLLDSDLEVVKKAGQAYRQRVEAMSAAEKTKALKKILEFMESPRVQKIKTPLATCLLIVGALRDPAAAKAVLRYVDKKMPPAVRNHALLALGSISLEGKDAQAAVGKLLPLLDEEDFQGIGKPALDVLYKLAPGKEHSDRLLKLQKSGGSQVKAYALRALGALGSSQAGDALLEALWSEDGRVADSAAQSFRTNPDYIPLLVKALEKQEDVAKAWKVVHLLTGFKNVLEKGLVRKFLARALSMLDRKESGFQAFFEVARAAAPDLAKKEVLDKGRGLLKKGKYEEAERALRLLQRDDLASPESDLALATAILRQQRLDVTGASRDQGHAVQLVLKLSRKDGFPLVKQLEKEASLLTPDGLLYLGFALIERQGAERDAGGAILKLVAKKYGSKEAGQVAKSKLKTQGL
jgi:HEAT repeat protein